VHSLPSAQHSFGLALLGGFELSDGKRSFNLPPASQRVLALLALEGRCLRRMYLAGTLWFNSGDSQAHACLRSALWRIRGCGRSLVETTREEVHLGRGVVVDVDNQIALARQALDSSSVIPSLPQRLLLEKELLPGWYDEWVIQERERLRQLRLNAVEAIGSRLSGEGLYAEAVEAAMVALRTDPLRESAYRVLIQAHLAAGNAAEALRQYRRYSDLLSARYGLQPSHLLRQLVTPIAIAAVTSFASATLTLP
jgi:DNA-binding SARP family transcriptional activator